MFLKKGRYFFSFLLWSSVGSQHKLEIIKYDDDNIRFKLHQTLFNMFLNNDSHGYDDDNNDDGDFV